MEWGDAATWTLVPVALAGLVFALLAARWSYRAFVTATGAAERADDARREAAERAQAALVAAWPISERETFQKAIARGVVGAAIRNSSPMPIYHVEIVHRDEGAGWSAVREDVIAENCVTQSMAEVRVSRNFGQGLLAFLSLGAYQPATITWFCAKPKAPDGEVVKRV